MTLTSDAATSPTATPVGAVRLADVDRAARHSSRRPRLSISLRHLLQTDLRVGRRFLLKFVLPLSLAGAYSLTMLAVTLFAAHQAAEGIAANTELSTDYNLRTAAKYSEVISTQRASPATVSDLTGSINGRSSVTAALEDGSTVVVHAAPDCMPKSDVTVGSSVLVFRVPGDASVPAMFLQQARCLDPDGLTASATSHLGLPPAPKYLPVRGYLVVEAIAMFGLTLLALGLRRTLLMRRYGIGASLNRKRRARRRNFLPVVGAAVVAGACLAYPMIDIMAPKISDLLNNYAF